MLTNYKLHSLKDKLNEETLEEAKKLAEEQKKETKTDKKAKVVKKENKTNE